MAARCGYGFTEEQHLYSPKGGDLALCACRHFAGAWTAPKSVGNASVEHWATAVGQFEEALALQGHATRLWKGIAALLFIVGLVLGVLVGRAL